MQCVCSAGYFSSDGLAECSPCEGGNFTNKTRSTGCDVCPMGSYSSGAATECTLCPSGYYCEAPGSSSYVPCTAGYYSSVEGSTECTICPPGTSSHEASSECTICKAGEYASDEGMKNCKTCEEGTYSHAGASECNACPGKSWSGEGSGSCKQVKLVMTFGESMLMFFIMAAFVGIVLWSCRTTVPHALAVAISSFDFISDLAYVAYSPFYRPIFLVLCFTFIFLAMGHVIYLQYRRSLVTKSIPRQFFGYPGTLCRLQIVNSVDSIPWIEGRRFFPISMTRLSDFNSFLLFLVAWIVAAFVQIMFAIVWFCFHFIYQLPWMIVHVPYYSLLFAMGLFLTQTKLIMHRDVKMWWLHLLWNDPGLLYIGM